MKRILAFLLVIFLLPMVNVYAADKTKVFVAAYNCTDEPLRIDLETAEGFEGGSVLINGETYPIDASGNGKHSVLLPCEFETPGEKTITVTTYYGGEEETDTKTIYVTKTEKTVTKYNYSNLNLTMQLSENGASGYESIDDDTVKVSFSDVSSGDHRLGRQSPAGVSNENPAGANYFLEYEILFENGDSEELETPNVFYTMSFRQDLSYQDQGYPLDSSTGAYPPEHSFMKIFYQGKICDKDEYYTNTWYKCRIHFDLQNRKENGDLVGGIAVFIAKMGEDGYGEFVRYKGYERYTMNNINQFRFAFSASGAGSMTIKNLTLTREAAIPTWYIENCEYENGKVIITPSEDMGEVTIDDFKVYSDLQKSDVKSISKTDDGKIEIEMSKNLIWGKKYQVYAKDGLCSASGSTAFYQSGTKICEFEVPKFSHNIRNLYKDAQKTDIIFNKTGDESAKYAGVLWKGEGGEAVDFTMVEITAEDGGSETVLRNNNKTASDQNVFIFDIDTNEESETYGGITIYEMQ